MESVYQGGGAPAGSNFALRVAPNIPEGVDASEWDPKDPSKKKLKQQRKFSFEAKSNAQSGRNKVSSRQQRPWYD